MAQSIPLHKRPVDRFYFAYFILHVFITIVIDSGVVVPAQYRPRFQQNLLDIQILKNRDPLLADVPPWFYLFVWIEVLVQLPFFVYGAWAMYTNYKRAYSLMLVYGVNGSLTTLACMYEIWSHKTLEMGFKLNLEWMYLPTFLIPLVMVFDMYFRLSTIISQNLDMTVKKDL
ncbi:transmembrane protein 6/97 [Dipodascopsis tothii]|uniref:transmembrane protein 6/97 n=1 Tax=Dipodascopsis tothii TaxID=44089 RepID=UPI0034D014C6